MKKSHAVSAIRHILDQELHNQKLDKFSESARLNEDLYLDSVLLMQLLLHLELSLGVEIPDTVLSKEDFATVSSLADFLMTQADETTIPNAPQAPRVEEFDDIKVHCFVSCLCESIKANPSVDHRPFYFGVWDSEVLINEKWQLAYHSDEINHDEFRIWYKRMYGISVMPWYQKALSKKENLKTLLTLIERKSESQHIMVMLDMFLLPERENKFNQNPFPHYVMLEKTDDPDIWFMHDPDFRWQGHQNKAQVMTAIASEAVAGGYIFDSSHIQASTRCVIRDYFLASFQPNTNPMTDAVRNIFQVHVDTDPSSPCIAGLSDALKQLPVLAIRKYAYEHGFAFFWRDIGFPDAEFEFWCDVIEELVSGYKAIQFRAMKFTSGQLTPADNTALVQETFALLDSQDEREFRIKRHLYRVFEQWCHIHQLSGAVSHQYVAPETV